VRFRIELMFVGVQVSAILFLLNAVGVTNRFIVIRCHASVTYAELIFLLRITLKPTRGVRTILQGPTNALTAPVSFKAVIVL
jgi:hypothetical protein